MTSSATPPVRGGLNRLLLATSRWPLALLLALGWGVGWLAWLLDARYRRRWRAHVALAGLTRRQALASVGAAGQMVMEMPRLWFGPPVPARWEGLAHIEAAVAKGQSVLFMTPHMGAFELTVVAHAQRFWATRPMTVLFRPPPKPEMAPLLAAARNREGLRAVPTTLSGVKDLVQTLKSGGTVGLLPDQVPVQGLGVWAPFFGREAYTMTLAARLAAHADVVLLAWAQRLPWARGYVIHVAPAPEPLAADKQAAAAQVNAWMEGLIRQAPSQYLWGYNRYKPPHP
jgi:KDO2-lipid IV(A) lauroyltransferase